jgi:uncharacterized protein with PIN domain
MTYNLEDWFVPMLTKKPRTTSAQSGMGWSRDRSMKQASFRFYAELNDFIEDICQYKRCQHRFRGQPGIKDVIEALGPPHTEIDLILVNDKPVGFDYALQDGDRVTVYPRFRSLEISSLCSVGPPTLTATRFVLDMHLGRLAAYLRMLGFDSLYWNEASDQRLAQVSHNQKRILLTRDRGLLKRNLVTYGYCIRQNSPRDQLKEVLDHFDLAGDIQPFRRCMRCNGVLEAVDKDAILAQLPERVRGRYERFRTCPQCGRVYWRGSHFERMQRLIDSVLEGT